MWRFTPESAPNEETRLIALLDGIGRTGSIAAAARELGMSYRHAWGRIDRWQGHFGRELVASGRGSGSRLSPFAAQLVTLDAQVRRRLAPHLAAADLEMAEILAGRQRGTHLRLRLVASHDLAVGSLAELMRERGHEVDLHFRGSVEAVAALADGGQRCRGLSPSGRGPGPARLVAVSAPVECPQTPVAARVRPGAGIDGAGRQSKALARGARPGAAGRALSEPSTGGRHAHGVRPTAPGTWPETGRHPRLHLGGAHPCRGRGAHRRRRGRCRIGHRGGGTALPARFRALDRGGVLLRLSPQVRAQSRDPGTGRGAGVAGVPAGGRGTAGLRRHRQRRPIVRARGGQGPAGGEN
ncbi:MAG: LysR family transcriptional regulator [Comamonadaceae bacterium]|nr:LysR family transcriptional regulator [Comamonadaceae bacterium]